MANKPHEVPATILEEQHSEIRQLIAQLRRSSFVLSDQDQKAGASAETLTLLQQLEGLLREHFALEETGEYLANALALAPRLTVTATRLLEQHNEFLEQLSRIIEQVSDAASSGRSGNALARRISRFADHLRNHDTAESQLIQSAYLDDHGGGG